MSIPQLWFKIVSWLTKQGKNQIIIFLFSLVITLLLVQNYQLKQDNDRLSDNRDSDINRCDTAKAIIEERLQKCNEKRQEDLEKANEYWAKKYEKLEERLYKNYENIKQVNK